MAAPSRAPEGEAAAPASDRPAPQLGTGYRPHLDGIRTVAVYLGVAFHVGSHRLSGGFIGVDMFFVLSGYLVTQLLMRDLGGRGRIDLKRFYSRRIRRLLPAATMALLATMVVFSAIAAPSELGGAQDAVSAAALHVSNWFFISQQVEYFGADLQSNPVVQFWSLSVEEQYYAAWPVLLSILFLATRRLGPRRWRVVQGVVLTGVLISFAAALLLSRTNLDRAYYGTDTRVYQLLGGSLLALAPGVLHRLHDTRPVRRLMPALAAFGLGGLLVLSTPLLEMGAILRGAMAAGCTLSLIIGMEAGPGGFVRKLLSLRPIVYLGKLSYGTYLWHWLVIVVAVRLADVSSLALFGLSSLIATGMAALSFELIERPVRESAGLNKRRGWVVIGGLALSATMGLIISPRIFELDRPGGPVAKEQGTAVGATPVPPDLDWEGAQNDVSDFPECTSSDPAQCTLVDGGGTHILLIGDSHARMYIPMFEQLAKDRDLTFSAAVVPACPWQDGLQYRRDQAACREHQADLYPGVVDALDPDVVVVANRTFDDPNSPLFVSDEDLGELPPDSEEYLASVEARTTATIDQFTRDGREVVVIEPIPVAGFGVDPITCLSEATFLDECRFVTETEPTPVEQMYRRVADPSEGVFAFDLDDGVCPYLPICDPIVDQLIVRRDTSHLTTRFARTLEGRFEEFFDENQIIE
jgi:peptidoglycan/LPS O-acetylase OafA/YrhL